MRETSSDHILRSSYPIRARNEFDEEGGDHRLDERAGHLAQALDLAFIGTHHPAGIWPTVWILARIVCLPLYLFNVTYFGSVAWGVSLVAIVAMLIR